MSSNTTEPAPQPARRGTLHIGAFLETPGLLWAILFLAIFAMAARVPADSDMWWHLRAGQTIWEARQIPGYDTFSHTVAGKAWTDVAWLAEVAMYGLYTLAGLPGLMLATALLVTLTFVPLAWVSRGHRFVRVFALLLAAIASSVSWVARPQMVTFLLLGVTVALLERFRARPRLRPLLLLAPLFALWANCHGGFPAGLIVLACVIGGETLERLVGWARPQTLPWSAIGRLALTALGCLAATLLNPYTYRVLLLPFQTVGMRVLQDLIQEWASPNFHLVYTQPFLVLLFLTILSLALREGIRHRGSTDTDNSVNRSSPSSLHSTSLGGEISLSDLALFAAFSYMALLAGRNISLAALVLAPILSRYASSALEALRQSPRLTFLRRQSQATSSPTSTGLRVLNGVVLTLLLAAALVKAAYAASATAGVIRETYPLGAVAYIRNQQLPREMFNPYNWGGFLTWAMPEYPVFVDGRTDLYDDVFLERYLQVAWAQPQWASILQEYAVRFALVESGSFLDLTLARAPDWRMAYRDSQAAVWVQANVAAIGGQPSTGSLPGRPVVVLEAWRP